MWFRFEPTVKNNFKTVSVEVLALLRILRVAVCRFCSGYQQRIIYLFPTFGAVNF